MVKKRTVLPKFPVFLYHGNPLMQSSRCFGKRFQAIVMHKFKEKPVIFLTKNIQVLHPNIVTHPYLYDRLLSDYLSEWRKIDSTDEEELFNKVMEKNKQLIKSFKKMRE